MGPGGEGEGVGWRNGRDTQRGMKREKEIGGGTIARYRKEKRRKEKKGGKRKRRRKVKREKGEGGGNGKVKEDKKTTV